MNALSTKLPWEQANAKWAAQLNPLLGLPIVNGQQISGIVLAATTPLAIYHSLGQAPQGWIVVDNSANAVLWRTQPLNAKTITLEASAATTISIWIY